MKTKSPSCRHCRRWLRLSTQGRVKISIRKEAGRRYWKPKRSERRWVWGMRQDKEIAF